MPDAFFQKKRKRTAPNGRGSSAAGPSPSKVKKGKARRIDRDASVSESEGGGDDAGGIGDIDLRHDYDDDEGRENETHAQARVRLAKAYLEGIRSEQQAEQDDLAYGADAAEIDRQNIAARLQRDVEEQSSRMHIFISSYLSRPSTSKDAIGDSSQGHLPVENVLAVRGHKLSITATAVTPDCHYLYTGSKEGHIFKWDLKDGTLVRILGKRPRVSALMTSTEKQEETKFSKRSGAARRRAMREAKARGPRVQGISTNGDQTMDVDGEELRLFVSLGEGEGHTDEILTLAVSPDGKYLASGGRDTRVGVWSIPPPTSSTAPQKSQPMEKWLRGLRGHKDAITALRFRQSTTSPYELFSTSYDRSIKLWAVDQLSYIETLFGHQDPVLDLNILRDETAVSAGGRDRTVRFWKIRNESQLIFRAGGLGKGAAAKRSRDMLEGGDLFDPDAKGLTKFKTAPRPGGAAEPDITGREFFEGSIDCVAMIDETNFLSGGDSGAISLWNTGKKKPIFTRLLAHGYDEFVGRNEDDDVDRKLPQPRWITALACLPYGDIFASGSWDGEIKIWGIERSLRSFKQLYSIPAAGFVNSLQLISPPTPARKDLGAYIRPELWRRRGGLVDIQGSNDAKKQIETALPNLDGNANDANEEDTDQVVSHKVRIAKERSSPMLIAGLGKEHRLGRWKKLETQFGTEAATVRNGTLIISLPLKD